MNNEQMMEYMNKDIEKRFEETYEKIENQMPEMDSRTSISDKKAIYKLFFSYGHTAGISCCMDMLDTI